MEHADVAPGSKHGISEDEYARQIWEEMNKRHHEARKPSAATAETWGQADAVNSHAQRMRDAAKEAEARSRKILEEEEAKDRAWREAIAQVGLSSMGMQGVHTFTSNKVFCNTWLLVLVSFPNHTMVLAFRN